MTIPSESAPLAGLRVAIFESRMAGPTADLIAKHGGVPLSAPSLREIPLGDSPEVTAFAEQLMAGGFDVVIFETGVGVRYLTQAIETRLPREAWLEALARTRVVARGPKPTAALRELGVQVDLHVPSPNTWHETLAALDAHLPVAGLRVAVQEYGKPNVELVEGLEQRGATVTRVPVYRWALARGPRAAACGHRRDRSGASRHRPIHVGPASRAPALQVAAKRGARGRSSHGLRDPHRRRIDRADDFGNPARARPAGRYRAGPPQAGPPHRGRRRRLARHGQGHVDLSCPPLDRSFARYCHRHNPCPTTGYRKNAESGRYAPSARAPKFRECLETLAVSA